MNHMMSQNKTKTMFKPDLKVKKMGTRTFKQLRYTLDLVSNLETNDNPVDDSSKNTPTVSVPLTVHFTVTNVSST